MKKKYKILEQQVFAKGNYSIVPIRFEDRFEIMRWRNEQIDILRQGDFLTEEIQNNYFNNVVIKLFDDKKPKQILFSYLKDKKLIGYGGLVHIDWENKNAEISFLLDTNVNNEEFYLKTFTIYLNLIKQVAKSIGLHKIFTYGYCTDEYRFTPLLKNDFKQEAHLKKHILIDKELIDIKIYAHFL